MLHELQKLKIRTALPKNNLFYKFHGLKFPNNVFISQERKLLKPMVKLIANMHGDETVGRELMLALARYLLQNNGRDPRVTRIVEELDIHILPSLNPDGFENATKGVCSGYHIGTGRHNGNLVDLNRAFPSWDNLALSQEELTATAQPEVAAIIDWVST